MQHLIRMGTGLDHLVKHKEAEDSLENFPYVYLLSPQEMDWAFVLAAHRDIGDEQKMEQWRKQLGSKSRSPNSFFLQEVLLGSVGLSWWVVRHFLTVSYEYISKDCSSEEHLDIIQTVDCRV